MGCLTSRPKLKSSNVKYVNQINLPEDETLRKCYKMLRKLADQGKITLEKTPEGFVMTHSKKGAVESFKGSQICQALEALTMKRKVSEIR